MLTESRYILDLASKGLRMDGRKPDQLRDIKLEVGVVGKAEGSAKVTWGTTEVLVGVKMDVREPFPDKPDDGVLIAGAELSPIASPNFESGPPRENTIELARVIDRAIRESKSIDTGKLCIKKGEKVWNVLLDVYVLNAGGNLMDAGCLAATAALLTTKLPKYDEKTGKVIFTEKTNKKLPFQFNPVEITHVKIGDKLFVDPTEEEENAAVTKLTVGVKDNGNICAMQKDGSEGLTIEEIEQIMKASVDKAKELRKLLEKF